MGATGQAEGSMATTTCLSMVVVAMSDGRIFNGLPEDKSYKQTYMASYAAPFAVSALCQVACI